jgi:hypothetical protein
VKQVIILLILVLQTCALAQSGSPSGDDGSWLFALKDFSELKFPASMLPSSDPVLLDVALSIDDKGRVHNTAVSPADTPFSEAAAKSVQKWRFAPKHSGELKAHICLGRQDDSQGIGLPCYVYGPEQSPHLRVLLMSSRDLSIESPLRVHLSALALARLGSKDDRVLWAHANVLIGEDGSVVEARASREIVDQDLARSIKQSLRFRPIHLSGRAVEAVTYVFMSAQVN